MTDLSPALDAELAKDNVLIFGALTFTVGGNTVRLLDGSSEIEIDGQLYRGEDSTYGVWASFESFEDGVGDEAPGMSIGIHPNSNEAAVSLSGPDMQGEYVSVKIGALNRATGQIIGEPYTMFDGEVDGTQDRFGMRVSEVELECAGGMDRFFFNEEGLRLAPAFHQQVWPDELGFNHVTGVRDTIYWGAKDPQGGSSGSTPWG